MTRDDKIIDILAFTKGRKFVEPLNIPIDIWPAVENGERLEEWMLICQQEVDLYYQEYGEQDTESIFAQFIREYEEDAEGLKKELKLRKEEINGLELEREFLKEFNQE